MSVKLRQSIIDEFFKVPRNKVDATLKDWFDNGHIRVEKKDWFNVFSDAVKAADEVSPGLPTSTVMNHSDWNAIMTYIEKNFISDSIVIIAEIKKNTNGILIRYRRNNTKKLVAGAGTIDLESYATGKLRKVMTGYFSTGQFKDLVEHVINSQHGSLNDYEHVLKP